MTSFAADIAPLFRDKDVAAMSMMFDLHDVEDVKENADGILETVQAGTMPCDETWTPEKVQLFRSWISEGFPA
ncbi:MAG: hypothetical protein NVS3B26_12920 [Mycobacteriales bacterium]